MNEPEKQVSSNGRRFFAVDGNQFHRACDAGMGSSVAYLVMAAGTGLDHSITSWSVNAIERYTGLSRGRAKAAIKDLRTLGLLRRYGKASRVGAHIIQRRRLILPARSKRNLIWLPTQLVTGAANEQAPIDLVREMGDPLAMRFLIDLYSVHLLPDYWGVDSRILWQSWNRQKVGERGEWVVWGFSSSNFHATRHPIIEPHIQQVGKKDDWDGLWHRLFALTNAGLVEWIPTLVGSAQPDAQPIMPVRGTLEPERLLQTAIEEAALEIIPGYQLNHIDDNLLLVPVRRHLSECQIRGIARMRYRPQSKPTQRWFASICECARLYLPIYQKIAGKIGVQDQGVIKELSRSVQGY